MRVKITEMADNAWILQNGIMKFKLDQKERKIFSRIMVNNMIVAYKRSKLGHYLRAPLHTSDMNQWNNYGTLIE